MDPEAEDLDHTGLLWSGSDGSQELCTSEPLTESYDEDDDRGSPSDPQNLDVSRSDPDSPGWRKEFPSEQNEVSVSCQGQDEICPHEPRQTITESPRIQASQTSSPSSPEIQDNISRQHLQPSSSSSLGSDADMIRALTPSTERAQGTRDRQGPETENRSIESSEEGGCGEAPPASVFSGISDDDTEQAGRKNLGSDGDPCKADRQKLRHTSLGHKESQSERHVKETKSKCRRIAQLLANAPNPQNKGAVLFKKRRQRVKKYTLVSYGTGVHPLDVFDPIKGEPDRVASVGCNFVALSDSDLEEQFSLYHQQHHLGVNWGRIQGMEALADTRGKGVLMFDQRRKRMDDLGSAHEEMMSRGLNEMTIQELQTSRSQNIYDNRESYVRSYLDNHEDIQQGNHSSTVSKSLVPNRTAKPFLGFQDGSAAATADMPVPATKMHEPKFKVPVPINTNPKVWSPTGDIIASRDERISVPAIKTTILPEFKRKTANKHPSVSRKESELHIQNKGDRRSYIESEEDCFSLGAEACNFMQPRTIKLKNPPPVAPKPTIDPACPPWMMKSSSSEPIIPSRSPVSQPSHSPVRPHSQQYLQQQDWAQPQQMASHWASDPTQAPLQSAANARVPINSSSPLHLQPTTNIWSQQPSQSPVSMQARSPTYSPHTASANKSESAPPHAGKPYVPQVSPKAQVQDRGTGNSHAGDGPAMAGKGAKLFAKRQSRMEKFVIEAETVQAHKTRSPSPTMSLPNSWRYSSNIRAPPPVSYNPLLSPFHPQPAAKQPLSTSPQIKRKEKPKSAPKQLNALDIMKHQPYQLSSSLFTYDATSEAKRLSPKPTPVSKFEVTKNLKQRSASSHSFVPSEPESHAKSSGLVSSQTPSTQSASSAQSLLTDKRLDEKLADAAAAPHTSNQTAASARPARTSSQHSTPGDSIASAFSPASLIARGVRQMAPRPTFSAKKPAVAGKQWKPVAMLPPV